MSQTLEQVVGNNEIMETFCFMATHPRQKVIETNTFVRKELKKKKKKSDGLKDFLCTRTAAGKIKAKSFSKRLSRFFLTTKLNFNILFSI